MGGTVLCFESDSAGVISVLKRRYAKFAGKGRLLCRISVRAAEGRQNPFKPLVEFSGNRLKLERGDFKAVLDLKTGLGELRAAPNEQCLDAFLRSLISFLLLHSGGFMLHSAGLVKNGKAYLFLGKSGAGKSTLAKLAAAAGTEVISDEINLLRFEGGRFRVYGSPFWGEMRSDGRQGNWPLGGIYLLGKAKANTVSPAAGRVALKFLLRCLVNFSKGPGTAELVMKNASRLLVKVEFRRLEFLKADSSFLELI